MDVIPWGKLRLGRRLGQGSEGTIREARYLDAPVAIKQGASSSEIEMFLAAGVHDNLVGLRGLTQQVRGSGGWKDLSGIAASMTGMQAANNGRAPNTPN